MYSVYSYVPDWAGWLVSVMSTSTPAQWAQASYILATGLVLGVAILPKRARTYLLAYGARNAKPDRPDGPDTPDEDGDGTGDDDGDNGHDDQFSNLIAKLTSFGQVKHSWFMGFYIASLACSFFWLAQYLTDGRIMHWIATKQATTSTPGMEPGQVVLLWILMCLQASRRLYEHLFTSKPSNSTMWIVHWALGVVYYVCMSLSVWIEGSGKMPHVIHDCRKGILTERVEAILQQNLLSEFPASLPPKALAATLVYLFAWVNQYLCHKHLAGLKKYSLPSRGMFRFLVCPHYTCECLLYLSMAVAGAPKGALFNTTLTCGLLFVVTNLGVTAGTTRQWYVDKFGADAVNKKWNMVPLLY